MDTIRPSKGEEGNSELGAILELQKMIAEELDLTGDKRAFTRSFTPLTDGLGLEGPKPKSIPAAPPPRELARHARRPTEIHRELEMSPPPPLLIEDEFLEPEPEPEPAQKAGGLAAVIEPASNNNLRTSSAPTVAPPPVPRPALWRRALATFVDEVFVLLLFAAAVIITLNVLGGSSNYFSLKGLNNFSGQQHPLLIKFAAMEFMTLWLCYFAICLGLVDMTFGMWVWGIRVGYGDESTGLKKFIRVLLSFFFFAPVLPLFLLMFRRRGRNLIDSLSGSHLYRSMV